MKVDEILDDFDVWCRCGSRECQRSVNYTQALAAINAEIAKAVREDRERIRLLLVEYGVVSSQIFNPTTEELRSLWHEIAQLEQPHEKG